MPIPAKANMPVVPAADRTIWNGSTHRQQYIAKYIDTYGNPQWNWSGEYIHIHHVIPLKYGGNNAFNNLYPLTFDLHTQTVSPWWTRY